MHWLCLVKPDNAGVLIKKTNAAFGFDSATSRGKKRRAGLSIELRDASAPHWFCCASTASVTSGVCIQVIADLFILWLWRERGNRARGVLVPGKVSSQKFHPKAATRISCAEGCWKLQLLTLSGVSQKSSKTIPGWGWDPSPSNQGCFYGKWEVSVLLTTGNIPVGWRGAFPSPHQQHFPTLTLETTQDFLPCALQTPVQPFPSPFWGQPARKLRLKTHPKLRKLLPEHLLGKKSLGQCSAAQKYQKRPIFLKILLFSSPWGSSGES